MRSPLWAATSGAKPLPFFHAELFTDDLAQCFLNFIVTRDGRFTAVSRIDINIVFFAVTVQVTTRFCQFADERPSSHKLTANSLVWTPVRTGIMSSSTII